VSARRSDPVAAAAHVLGTVRIAMTRCRDVAVVVAVSGGGDSVALLRSLEAIASECRLRLTVAHLDHGVRGAAALADAQFVAALAGSLNLPCEFGQWSPARAGHFEADARRARYAWLLDVARRRNATVVAVGHTLDDQAETILHRVLRGTGLRGLAGIPARRRLASDLLLIRPLLAVSRQEARDYLAAIGQAYCEDESNADWSQTRARIRHELLPSLAEAYNPRIAEALVRLGRLAGESDRRVRAWVAGLEKTTAVGAAGDEVVFDRQRILRIPPVIRAELVRRVWRRRGWPEVGMSACRWHRIAKLCRESRARVSVGSGIELVASSSRVCLRRMSCD
jgi:tRNA(Ile)-lysidine synthase